MKKLISLILVIAFIYSCSTSNDGNGNSTTTVVPVAPTNLTGIVFSPTQINLSWTDNSTNETGFKIERKTGTGTYTVVGTTASDVTTFNDTGLIPSTTYLYRVYSYNSAGNSSFSNVLTIQTLSIQSLAIITTTALSNITANTALSGGNITSDGGSIVTARGIVWSISQNPTISLSTKTIDGTGSGIFSSNMLGLNPNTNYYVRAYATNSLGTSYGNQISFNSLQNVINGIGPNVTDVDGNVYQSVINCNQTFTSKNLNVTKYSDGTPIPQVTDPSAWANLTTGAWCYYNNVTSNGNTYGKLYNWYAVKGIYDLASASNPNLRKKLAPTGWHIPTLTEWNTLVNCLGSNAAVKMKSSGTQYWFFPPIATDVPFYNISGFNGLPGGFRSEAGISNALSYVGSWWCSTELSLPNADSVILQHNNGSSGTATSFNTRFDIKSIGLSIRCVKD